MFNCQSCQKQKTLLIKMHFLKNGMPSWTSVEKLKKALEEARNEKVIGKSLEAHLTIYPDAEVKELLEV